MWIEFERQLAKVLYRSILQKNPTMEYIHWDKIRFSLKLSSYPNETLAIVRPSSDTIYHQGTFFRVRKLHFKTFLPKVFEVAKHFTNLEGNLPNKLATAVDGRLLLSSNRIAIDISTDDVEVSTDMGRSIYLELHQKVGEERFTKVPLTQLEVVRTGQYENFYLYAYTDENHPLFYGDCFIPLK